MLGLKFHIIRLLSSDDVTSCFMFGLNAHAVTAPLCPRNVRSSVGSSEWNASFAIGTPPKRTIVGDGVWSRASRARVCGARFDFLTVYLNEHEFQRVTARQWTLT